MNYEYPLWSDPKGTFLPQLFKNPDAVQQKIAQFPPQRDTVIQLSFLEFSLFPSGKVISSCGQKELDRLALKAAICSSSVLRDSDILPASPLILRVQWKEVYSRLPKKEEKQESGNK